MQGATGYTEAQIKANPAATGFVHEVGDVTATPGETIDHEWISGCVSIPAAATNVTIKDSLITPGGDQCAGGDNIAAHSAINNGNQTGGEGLTIEDTTVDGQNIYTASGNGISVHDAKLLRVNAFGISKNYVLPFNDMLTDSYSHDAAVTNTGDHNDPVFINSGSHVTVKHDYIIGTGGAYGPGGGIAEALAIQADYGPDSYITIDSSYAEGVTNYDAFFGGCTSKNSDQNHFTVTNNAFSNDNVYGPAANWNYEDPTNVWGPGNYLTDAATGANLGPYGPPGC